jgi:uncharacterized membrane protein YtjA (UPF0391 family)
MAMLLQISEIQLAPKLLHNFCQGRYGKLEIPGDEVKGEAMLNWALMFFVVALLAAIFGFTGIAVAAAGIAKILFFVFLVLFLVSLIAHAARRV